MKREDRELQKLRNEKFRKLKTEYLTLMQGESKSLSPTQFIMATEPQDIAAQLTLIDHEAFRSISVYASHTYFYVIFVTNLFLWSHMSCYSNRGINRTYATVLPTSLPWYPEQIMYEMNFYYLHWFLTAKFNFVIFFSRLLYGWRVQFYGMLSWQIVSKWWLSLF